MAITSDFTNIATTTRASKAWDGGAWDFVSGSAVGALVEYAANAPRITSSGLLVEESTTNEIRNPRAEGAAAGSPGTAPTNWQANGLSSTVTIVGSGTEDGWDYVDIKFAGTPTGDPFIAFETTTAITAADAETWTQSAGIKVVAGDQTNITNIRFTHVEYTSGGSFVTATDGSALTIDSTHRRFHSTATLSGGGTVARYRPALEIDWTSGAIDITLRIYNPQAEEKAYPTSPVLPTVSSPAASTRNVDNVSLTLGSWYNAAARTLMVDFTPNTTQQSSFQYVATLYTSGSTFAALYYTGGVYYMNEYDGGGGLVSATLHSVTAATSTKLAYAYAPDDMAVSGTTATQTLDSSGTQSTGLTTLYIGTLQGATYPTNAYIRDLRFWPRRLTNAELEALVGN